jgi:type II secretory pathway component PulF
MKSKYPISLGKSGAPPTKRDDASTIARLKEENEILRRLATLLSAQLNLARGLSLEGQRPSQERMARTGSVSLQTKRIAQHVLR